MNWKYLIEIPCNVEPIPLLLIKPAYPVIKRSPLRARMLETE